MKKITMLSLSALVAVTLLIIAGFTSAEKATGQYATLVVKEKVNDSWSCETVIIYENGTTEKSELMKIKSGDIESGSKTITASINKLSAEGYTLVSSCKGMNAAVIMTTYVFEKK